MIDGTLVGWPIGKQTTNNNNKKISLSSTKIPFDPQVRSKSDLTNETETLPEGACVLIVNGVRRYSTEETKESWSHTNTHTIV